MIIQTLYGPPDSPFISHSALAAIWRIIPKNVCHRFYVSHEETGSNSNPQILFSEVSITSTTDLGGISAKFRCCSVLRLIAGVYTLHQLHITYRPLSILRCSLFIRPIFARGWCNPLRGWA